MAAEAPVIFSFATPIVKLELLQSECLKSSSSILELMLLLLVAGLCSAAVDADHVITVVVITSS